MITRAAILSVLLCAVSTTQGMLYETTYIICICMHAYVYGPCVASDRWLCLLFLL